MAPSTRRPPVALAAEAMRTRFEVVIADDRDPAALTAAGEEALEEISRVEADLSVYRSDSLFTEVNVDAAVRPVRLDPATFRLVQRAGALTEDLDGAFDLTVGPLLDLWRGTADFTPEDLDRVRALVGFGRNVRLDAEAFTVRFAAPGVRLDPGAIGKGYALERAADLLRELGVGSALLHGGTSSVCAIGTPPGGQGWTVAIADPLDTGRALARVVLRDGALGVSAPHGRVFERRGRTIGHVLDPRSGEPVAGTALAAVVTASPTDADAISTALLVSGAGALDALAARFPGASFLVATPEAGDLRIDVLGDAFVGS